VRLARAARVGDTAWFVADATTVESVAAKVSGNDRHLKPDGETLHLEATERIEAVGPGGQPTRATYRIEKCASRDGTYRGALSPGTVLTVEAGKWKSAIRRTGGRLNIRDEIFLRSILSLPNLGDATADDAFGSTEPRRVGETWAVNAEALARWMSREGTPVDPRSVSGTVKLKAVQAVNGVPCLLVTGRAVIEHWVPEKKDIPDGFKVVSASDEVKFTKLVPADAAGGLCLVDSYSDRATMKVATAEGAIRPDLLAEVKVLKTVGIKRTPNHSPDIAWGAD
jgi:hypothetical protein